MSLSSDLPQHICEECRNLLEISYSFHKLVRHSEDELRRRLDLNYKLLQNTDTNNGHVKEEPFSSCDDHISEELDTNIDCSDELHEKPIKTENHDLIFGKDYISEDEPLNHVRSNSSQKKLKGCKKLTRPYKCEFCKKKFKREELLLSHMIVHSTNIDNIINECQNVENYRCTECSKSFSGARALSSHMKKHTNVDKMAVFQCDTCNKEFKSKPLLRRHILIHSSDRPFQCTKCPRSYTRLDQLITHFKIHTGVKAYPCTLCNKCKLIIKCIFIIIKYIHSYI